MSACRCQWDCTHQWCGCKYAGHTPGSPTGAMHAVAIKETCKSAPSCAKSWSKWSDPTGTEPDMEGEL